MVKWQVPITHDVHDVIDLQSDIVGLGVIVRHHDLWLQGISELPHQLYR